MASSKLRKSFHLQCTACIFVCYRRPSKAGWPSWLSSASSFFRSQFYWLRMVIWLPV